MTAQQAPPWSRGGRTLRFRVRPGLDVPFTRLEVRVAEAGVVADALAYATLVEIVRFGEDAGTASRVLWHVNPSKRQLTALRPEQAEELLREVPFRVGYSRSRLVVGGRAVVLVEFDETVDAGPFVLLDIQAGERVAPPAWAAEDVTHDPSTEIMQVVLDASRQRRASGRRDE